MNERKLAGANYIINYFNEINNLKVAYSQYISLLLQIKTKHGNEPEKEGMEEGEKQAVSQLAQTVRHYCHLCYISYISIFSTENFKIDKKVEQFYNKICNTYIIESNILKEFVILLNKSLLNEIIKDLLVSSQETISEIYKEDEEGRTA